MDYSLAAFTALSEPEKSILALFALSEQSFSKARLMHVLRAAHFTMNGKAINDASLKSLLDGLSEKGCLNGIVNDYHNYVSYWLPEAWSNSIIHACLIHKSFDTLCAILIKSNVLPNNPYSLSSYQAALASLRIALLQGQPPEIVHQWLRVVQSAHFRQSVDRTYEMVLGPVYYPEWLARLHPDMLEEVLTALLNCARFQLHSGRIAFLSDYTLTYLKNRKPQAVSAALGFQLADILLLSGRLAEALALCQDADYGLLIQAAVHMLQNDSQPAVNLFISGLKALRQVKAYRNALIPGFCGYLYVIALLREKDAKLRKQAHSYLHLALKNSEAPDYLLWTQLDALAKVQAGDANVDKTNSNPFLFTQLFQALLYHWTHIDQCKLSHLKELIKEAEQVECLLVVQQMAALLVQLGHEEYQQRVDDIQRQTGMQPWLAWFTCQEAWENQLSALMHLYLPVVPSANPVAKTGQKRLCWLFDFSREGQVLSIVPHEQKGSAKGVWSVPKEIPLKKLQEKFEEVEASLQDRKLIAATYMANTGYYGRPQLEMNIAKALPLLVGHPLIFSRDNYQTTLELVAGAPELIVKEKKGQYELSFNLTIDPDNSNSIILIKETPLRWKVIELNEHIKKIARILGDKLIVPLQAKDRIVNTIQTLASVVTIQSDLAGDAQAQSVAACGQLHVHLLPHNIGLKCQIRVRPLGDGGPYYEPGSGSVHVIAEINKNFLQAERSLQQEMQALQNLLKACPAFEMAEKMHDQWLLEEPAMCLDLLSQLQEWQAQANNLIVAWPEGEKFKVSRVVDAKKMQLSISRNKDWFEAHGEITVDADQVLQLRQLLELVKESPSRFVPLADNSFLALSESFHQRLREFAYSADFKKSQAGARIHGLATHALEDLVSEAGQVKTDKAWCQQLERLKACNNFVATVPNTLQAELRDYQIEGYIWLSRLAEWGVGACLADDMGLGKTLQALALLLSRASKGPALVIAPTSVCTNWYSETARFAPTLNVITLAAANREKSVATLGSRDVVIVSYGILQQEIELLTKTHWSTLILDEAQSIKNAHTKRSQAVTTLNADFRLIMTGTPLENHLAELWSLFRFINPGLLGSLEQFNHRFALPIERDQDSQARDRLRKIIHPFMLRRTKNKVLTELPPRIEIVRLVELSSEEKALYEALRQTALANLEAIEATADKKPLQILAEITKLRRACCHPQLVAPELQLSGSKLAAFGELLDELLSNNHKALVFSQFVGYLDIIRQYLDQRGVAYQYLDGSTPAKDRKQRVDAFQAGASDLFLISLKAGGTGLNLTAADYVIHMDPWWNPAVEDQASDRAHRMGQARPVTIYRLVAKHTIEESIVHLHSQKRDLADSLLIGTDVAAKMSAHEMLALLKEEL